MRLTGSFCDPLILASVCLQHLSHRVFFLSCEKRKNNKNKQTKK